MDWAVPQIQPAALDRRLGRRLLGWVRLLRDGRCRCQHQDRQQQQRLQDGHECGARLVAAALECVHGCLSFEQCPGLPLGAPSRRSDSLCSEGVRHDKPAATDLCPCIGHPRVECDQCLRMLVLNGHICCRRATFSNRQVLPPPPRTGQDHRSPPTDRPTPLVQRLHAFGGTKVRVTDHVARAPRGIRGHATPTPVMPRPLLVITVALLLRPAPAADHSSTTSRPHSADRHI